MNIHVYFHNDPVEDSKLDQLLKAVNTLVKQEKIIMTDLTALTTQVKANTDAEASAITLLNGLSAQIAGIKNDPVAIQALADQLKASADNLGAAIVANTPAGPGTPDEPIIPAAS